MEVQKSREQTPPLFSTDPGRLFHIDPKTRAQLATILSQDHAEELSEKQFEFLQKVVFGSLKAWRMRENCHIYASLASQILSELFDKRPQIALLRAHYPGVSMDKKPYILFFPLDDSPFEAHPTMKSGLSLQESLCAWRFHVVCKCGKQVVDVRLKKPHDWDSWYTNAWSSSKVNRCDFADNIEQFSTLFAREIEKPSQELLHQYNSSLNFNWLNKAHTWLDLWHTWLNKAHIEPPEMIRPNA